MKNKFKDHLEEWNKAGGFGPLIKIEDVPSKEMAKISTEIFARIKISGEENKYIVWSSVLHKYGIMCPHPQVQRLYGGKIESNNPLFDYSWFECKMCNCAVFNEQYFRKKREEENNKSVGERNNTVEPQEEGEG